MNQTTTPATNRVQPMPHLRQPVIVRLFAPRKAARPAAARGRTARRALLWGALALALAHLGLVATVETVPQLRDPDYGYRLARVREQQRLHPDRPLVLTLGTSRTSYGIDPKAMAFPDEPGAPLVFNFGVAGARPPHLRLHLQRLRADGVRPAAVLAEFFPATLVVPGPADPLFAPDAARLAAADLERLEPYLADPAALRRRWFWERVNPWGGQRLVIINHLAPGFLPWQQRIDHLWTMTDELGYCPYPMGDIEGQRGARTEHMRQSYASGLQNVRPTELADRSYRDLVADCRAAGTPVAFFVTPESPEFRSWYPPHSRAAVADYVRKLREELGCPVFLAPDGDFAEDDFADGHHILPNSAARYSRRLADEHLRPWLAKALK